MTSDATGASSVVSVVITVLSEIDVFEFVEVDVISDVGNFCVVVPALVVLETPMTSSVDGVDTEMVLVVEDIVEVEVEDIVDVCFIVVEVELCDTFDDVDGDDKVVIADVDNSCVVVSWLVVLETCGDVDGEVLLVVEDPVEVEEEVEVCFKVVAQVTFCWTAGQFISTLAESIEAVCRDEVIIKPRHEISNSLTFWHV